MLTAVVLLVVFFVGLLGVKAVSGVRVCALCGAVSGTWVVLLGMYHVGSYANRTVIALLVGQSIVGGFYLVRNRVAEPYEVYSLPAFLTATVLGYTLLVPAVLLEALAVVALTWLAAGILFAYRENQRVEALFDEVVACCRDW